MSILRLIYNSRVPIDVYGCQEVHICLCCDWKTKTVTGSSLVRATVSNTGRRLGRPSLFRRILNSRGSDVFQYQLEIDDSQFIENPATPGTPYQPTCEDIRELFPYNCVGDAIIDGVSLPA